MHQQQIEQRIHELRLLLKKTSDPEQRVRVDQRLYHWEQQKRLLKVPRAIGPAVSCAEQ